MAEERKVQLGFAVDADGVKQGLNEIKQDVRDMARDVEKSGKQAGDGLNKMRDSLKGSGDGAPEASKKVERATSSIIGSIERATAAMKTGEKGSAAYFEALGRQRGVSADVLRPYIEQLREAERAQREAKTSMDSMGQSAKSTSDSFAGLARTGIQAFLGSALLKATKDVGAAMFEASAQAERFRTTLNFATGGRGTQEIDYLRRVTNELGLAFNSTAQAYSSFQAAARGTALEGQKARDVFESISKASAVMGLSAEQSGGALQALQQMISKGTVQAEELRGQLSERLPGAFQIAAKAMGVTTAELGKMLEQGQVISSDFLPKFAKAMNDHLGNAAEDAANRLDAAVNRFANAWERLKQAGGDSGVSKAMANEMNALTRDVSAVTETMENAAKSGQSMFAQLASAAAVGAGRMAFSTLNLAANTLNGTINALTGDILGLNTKMAILPDAFKTNAEQALIMGREVEAAQAKLKRLQELDAMPANGNYFKSAIAQTQAYIAKLQEAIRLRGAAGGEQGDPRDIPATMTRGASYSRWAQEQKESEQKMLEIRMRQSGVNKQYLQELKDLEQALARQVITQDEYTQRVSNLAKTTWDASAAGKDAAKTARESAKATKEAANAFAAQQDAAKAWASTLQKAEQGIAAVENKTAGLNAAQAELLGYLSSPAYATNTEEMRQMALARLYAWDAAIKHADATKQEQQAIEAAAKAVAAWNDARIKESTGLDEQIRARQEEIGAMGLSAEAVAELTAAKYDLAAAEKEAYAAALENASQYAGPYQEAYKQAAKDAEAQAKKLRDLANLERVKGAKKAAKEAEDAWNKSAQDIERALTDSLFRAFESGKDFGEALADTLKATFNTLVLRPIISAVMQPVSGMVSSVVGGMMGGGGTGGIGGLANLFSTGSSLYQMVSTGFSSAISTGFSTFAMSPAGQSLGLSAMGAGGMGPPALTSAGSAIGTAMPYLAGAGIGYGLGSMISGGYSAIGKGGYAANIGGTAIGMILGGPIGAIIGGALGGAVNRLFGRKLQDWGIEGTLGGDTGFEGREYEFYRGGMFRSDKTKYRDLEEDVRQGIADAYKAIQSQVGTFATVLGLETDKIADFTSVFKFSTKDLDEAGIQEAFAQALRTGSNELAQQLIGTWREVSIEELQQQARGGALGDVLRTDANGGFDAPQMRYVASEYAREGEEAIDTLTRLATSLTAANNLFEMLGTTLYEASLAGGDMASQLADLFGGIEQMGQAAGAYFQNFYSADEQRDYARRMIERQLQTLDLTLPDIDATDARQQWRALAEAQDLTTESGRKAWAMLMQLSGAFAEVTQSAEQAADASRRAAEEAAREAERKRQEAIRGAYDLFRRAVERDRSALQDQASAISDVISSISGSIELLKSNARELYGEVESTAQMLAAQGMVYIEQALGGVRAGGSLVDYGRLDEAISAARGGISNGAYATQFDRDRDTLVLAGQLSELGELGEVQLSIEERQLKAINEQIGYLDNLAKRADELVNGTTALTGTVEAYFSQLMALFGGKDAPVTDSQGNGPSWGGGSGTAAPSSGASYSRLMPDGSGGVWRDPISDEGVIARLDRLSPVYHRFDGTGDLVGLAEAFKAAGGTIADLSILSGYWEKDWRAALAGVGIPAFAVGTNYVPRDMVAQIHQGEAIVPKAFNPWAGGQGMQSGNAELVAEVRALREDNRAQAGQIIRLQGDIAKLMQRWEGDGLPAQREKEAA